MTGAIKGNGMALGLTNGTGNGGMVQYVGTTDLQNIIGAYGLSVSNTYSGSNVALNGVAGITTDASKSGMIVYRDSSKYLFFFIN